MPPDLGHDADVAVSLSPSHRLTISSSHRLITTSRLISPTLHRHLLPSSSSHMAPAALCVTNMETWKHGNMENK